MLYRTRAIAVNAANNILSSVNVAADIVATSLTTIDKGIWWCSAQIDKSMSDDAKTSWLEHEARLNGFSTADSWKKFQESEAKAKAEAEAKEIAEAAKEKKTKK